MERVEALRGSEEFDGADGPDEQLNLVLGMIERAVV